MKAIQPHLNTKSLLIHYVLLTIAAVLPCIQFNYIHYSALLCLVILWCTAPGIATPAHHPLRRSYCIQNTVSAGLLIYLAMAKALTIAIPAISIFYAPAAIVAHESHKLAVGNATTTSQLQQYVDAGLLMFVLVFLLAITRLAKNVRQPFEYDKDELPIVDKALTTKERIELSVVLLFMLSLSLLPWLGVVYGSLSVLMNAVFASAVLLHVLMFLPPVMFPSANAQTTAYAYVLARKVQRILISMSIVLWIPYDQVKALTDASLIAIVFAYFAYVIAVIYYLNRVFIARKK